MFHLPKRVSLPLKFTYGGFSVVCNKTISKLECNKVTALRR